MRRTLPQERIEGLLQDSRGLTTTEVSARRARYGANDIVKESRLDWRDVFGTTARDPMAWFLVATAGLFYYVGDTAEANVLLAAILPIVGMDLYLHRRTQASTAGLAGSLATTARVRRDNAESTIATSDVVPGDLVIVGPSEMFAADGIVLQGEHLQVDESALTGESWPVQKSLIDRPTIEPDGVVIDDEHWVQAGTRLLTGEAVVRIVNTGAQTQYGEIVRAALFEAHEMTPLQSAIGRLVGVLVIAAIGLCLLLAGVRLYQGFGFVDALQSALTLAVAALPEEFPVVFTVFLGVGVYRLARRHALVRRAVVVENIGRVTTICTDKTGTITAGLVQLHEALPDVGSRPESVIEAGALASRQESGDPLDSAILRRASSPPLTRLARSFPFTEDRKRETNVYRGDRDDVLLAYTKGAPETVFELCEMDAAAMAHWQAEITRLASAGFKVI
ncbi:MAG: cation-transporting P-type ATPase, partial [Pseudomonadales bacterium]|nr:cation-transporting P-type ATPase [Pseudomonadales bacterium]